MARKTAKTVDVEVTEVKDLPEVPDGGVQAWLQIVPAFFLWFNTWGLVNAYGAWQAYYEVDLLREKTPSDIAWIGSVQGFLLLFVGSFAGALFYKGYVRHLVFVGGSLLVLGIMMTSVAKTYTEIMLAQGLCAGLGMACLFPPTVSTLTTWFSTKVSTANGLAAAGSGLGGVIYTVAFHRLQSTVGFGWATRAVGFIVLGTMVVPAVMLRVHHIPAKSALDKNIYKDVPYMLYILGALVLLLGLWTPFYYAEVYALRYASQELSFYLLAIITAVSTIGRLLPGVIAVRIGMINVLIICCVIAGIACLCLTQTDSFASIVVTTVIYGFFSGGALALGSIGGIALSPSRALMGSRILGTFLACSIGFLCGTPITGHLSRRYGYDAAWIFGGVSVLVACALVMTARVMKVGFKLTAKL